MTQHNYHDAEARKTVPLDSRRKLPALAWLPLLRLCFMVQHAHVSPLAVLLHTPVSYIISTLHNIALQLYNNNVGYNTIYVADMHIINIIICNYIRLIIIIYIMCMQPCKLYSHIYACTLHIIYTMHAHYIVHACINCYTYTVLYSIYTHMHAHA